MTTGPEISLPAEILEQIFSYVTATTPQNQYTLHSCTLVSRSWYPNSIAFLYDSPNISGKNFDAFVRAICPSVNAHVRTNGLADFVRRLDMSNLVHNGSKSLTARILGRVKGNMEEFIAPQASFAVNCLAALSKCHKLHLLNLSFVSESITMSDLFRSTSTLHNLKTLHLPRSSTQDSRQDLVSLSWPCNLQELHMSGGVRDTSCLYFKKLPPSVTSLHIGNCPHLTMRSIYPMLSRVGASLLHLEILAPMPVLTLDFTLLHEFLRLLPNLLSLKVSVDFMYTGLLGETFENPSLRRLDLHCFDPAECSQIKPSDVYFIVGLDAFAKVRIVGFHDKLGWEESMSDRQDLLDLDELLKALAREDGPDAVFPEEVAGLARIKSR